VGVSGKHYARRTRECRWKSTAVISKPGAVRSVTDSDFARNHF
jgi:hypothetical protein